MGSGLKGMFDISVKVSDVNSDRTDFKEAMVILPVNSVASVIENPGGRGSIIVFKKSSPRAFNNTVFVPFGEEGNKIYCSDSVNDVVGKIESDVNLLSADVKCYNLDELDPSETHNRLVAIPVEGVTSIMPQIINDYNKDLLCLGEGSRILIKNDYSDFLCRLTGGIDVGLSESIAITSISSPVKARYRPPLGEHRFINRSDLSPK